MKISLKLNRTNFISQLIVRQKYRFFFFIKHKNYSELLSEIYLQIHHQSNKFKFRQFLIQCETRDHGILQRDENLDSTV